jgi:hypothetical protein
MCHGSFLWVNSLQLFVQQEIKLSALRAKSTDEYAETDQEMANAMISAAKKTLISQAMQHFFHLTCIYIKKYELLQS